jgi:hypothetical protein
MPEPQQPVHWLDANGNQIGPEPFEVVLQRVQAGQIPSTTSIWWEGAADWTSVDAVTGGTAAASAADSASPTASDGGSVPPATSASEALMSGLSDQQLDDEFIGLIGRSWEMYKETELATSIDEAMLGGVITALVDCGFVLIDLETAGALAAMIATGTGGTGATVTTTATTGVDVGSTATAAHHQLRFEEPETHARVTVAIEHLTPDVASAKMIGHRASAILGYGERVPNFSQVGQALRQEVQSNFVVSPEPGTVTFDADISSGYVYAQVDLLMELDRYVSEDLAVDHDLLRRHLASVVYTMKTFVRSRFGG